ncbi:MAG TPA: hypothetical protein VE974_18675 [Thermoanaerobaculia bacterium]|nr:hypothetical protein [Thermoanaerobaculia bacterium]
MSHVQRELDSISRASFAAWLRLAKPIPAKLGEQALLALDLGPAGALLSGRCSYAPGTEHDFAFAEGGIRVKVRCLITGVAEHLLTPDTDLLVRFLEQSDALADYIARYEAQIRRAETANADGDAARNVIDGDRTLSDLGSAARSKETFLRCQLNDGAWTREVTASADQPPDGFTIAASETEDQIQLLRLAYEESDNRERRLLREFAAASLAPMR